MPQTLLLADDSVTIQRVIELTFADEAITVVAVSDGDRAIERIEAAPPDIVLVDIGMPGRTGYEVAQHIKQSPRLQHIPVLLLTGAFEPVDQAKATAAGCDGVLAKPFEPQLVIARVKELLGRGREAPAPAAPADITSPAPSLPTGQPGPSGDIWAGPQAEADTHPPPSASQSARLDDYFDQLDAAFQELGGNARADQAKGPAATSPTADIIDWFGGPSAPSGPGPDLPLSTAAPDAQREHAPDAGAEARTPIAPRFVAEPASETATTASVPEPPSPPATLPPIADAFAAILAAEQHEPMPAVWPQWTTTPAPPPPSNGGGASSEDAIEEVTRRVLDRLSDRVVRQTVEDIVSGIAERLVREEIDRIKSAIK